MFQCPLADSAFLVYMIFNSGALGSKPSAQPEICNGPRARFFVLERIMNDLVAKAAIDRRIAEIITPVVEDMGFEVVRVRLMTGKESILQVMAQSLTARLRLMSAARSAPRFRAVMDVEDPILDAYTLGSVQPRDRPSADTAEGFRPVGRL